MRFGAQEPEPAFLEVEVFLAACVGEAEIVGVGGSHGEGERRPVAIAIGLVIVAQARLGPAGAFIVDVRFDEAGASTRSVLVRDAERGELRRQGVERDAEQVFANVAEAAPVPLVFIVAVAGAERAPGRDAVRGVGVEGLTRDVELVRDAGVDFLGHGVEPDVFGRVERRRLIVAFVESVPDVQAEAAAQAGIEVDERVDAADLGFCRGTRQRGKVRKRRQHGGRGDQRIDRPRNQGLVLRLLGEL